MTEHPEAVRRPRAGWFMYPREFMDRLLATEGPDAHAIWCALVSMATYKPITFDSPYGTVELQRGELLYSHRAFAQRIKDLTWAAVRSRVDRWARNGQLKKRPLPVPLRAHTRAHPPTIITIVDYDTYSPPSLDENTPDDTHSYTNQSNSDTEEQGT